MKKAPNRREESAYWKEIVKLFGKAGAFGIINLFQQPSDAGELSERAPGRNRGKIRAELADSILSHEYKNPESGAL